MHERNRIISEIKCCKNYNVHYHADELQNVYKCEVVIMYGIWCGGVQVEVVQLAVAVLCR